MNLQELHDRRLQREFVGREKEIEHFLANLTLSVDQRQIIFDVHGPKGVGRSMLLRRYRYLVQQESDELVLIAWIDENNRDVLSVLSGIAAAFSQQGVVLTRFAEQQQLYQQQASQLRSSMPADSQLRQMVDLGQPTDLHRKLSQFFNIEELQSLCLDLGIEYENLPGSTRLAKATELVRYCNRLGLRAALMAQCATLRPGVDWRDTSMIADGRQEMQTDALWEAHVRRHLQDENLVQLILSPVPILTRYLLQDLAEALTVQTLLLFFDDFHKTRDFLNSWVCGLLDGRYGPVSEHIIFIIAGDKKLNDSCWLDYAPFIVHQTLAPFTEDEARAFLNKKGLQDDQQIETILKTVRKSGRGGYSLVDLATAVAADVPTSVTSRRNDNAVTLFLKSIDDRDKREAALWGALPRAVDADVLALLLDHDAAMGLMEWLALRPFVKANPDGRWVYHDNMRGEMLAYNGETSPQTWIELHGRLAAYFLGYRAVQGQNQSETRWHDPDWQAATLNVIYHRLCQSVSSRRHHLSYILGDFLCAFQATPAFAQRWANTIEQAGKDSGSSTTQDWGRQLTHGLQAFNKGDFSLTAEILTKLLGRATLALPYRVIALRWRGDTHRLMRHDQQALADFDEALQLDPQNALAYASRAETLLWMERYDEALRDFDQAISIDHGFVWAIARRGELYRRRGQNELALADFDQAITLDPNLSWAIANRGELHRTMGQLETALTDFDRAIKLNPTYAWAIASRGQIYRKLGQFEKALTDLNQAVDLNPDYYWAMGSRGQAYRKLKQYDEALADFNHAVDLNPGYAWAVAERAKTYREMGQYDKALADFDQAIELDPQYNWAIAGRGETYRLMEQYDKALADFDQVLASNPDDNRTQQRRERVHKALESG